MLDYLIVFIAEIIFELGYHLLFNKKIPLVIRILISFFLIALFASVITMFIYLGLKLILDGNYLGILFMLIGTILLISTTYKIIKDVKKNLNKDKRASINNWCFLLWKGMKLMAIVALLSTDNVLMINLLIKLNHYCKMLVV